MKKLLTHSLDRSWRKRARRRWVSAVHTALHLTAPTDTEPNNQPARPTISSSCASPLLCRETCPSARPADERASGSAGLFCARCSQRNALVTGSCCCYYSKVGSRRLTTITNHRRGKAMMPCWWQPCAHVSITGLLLYPIPSAIACCHALSDAFHQSVEASIKSFDSL